MSQRLRLPLAAAVLALAAGTTAAAPAPDTGKNAVLPYPAKAPIVVHVNGLEQVRDRLGKALTAAAPDLAPGLNKSIDDALKQALQGRQISAVGKGPAAFSVARSPQERVYYRGGSHAGLVEMLRRAQGVSAGGKGKAGAKPP